jgi:primosomal protein N''
MSKYMQITVTVSPYYHRELGDAYPKLARQLGYLDKAMVQQNPSLYQLAGRLDELLLKYDGTPLREVLLRQRDSLRQLHKDIEKDIADWNLAQADKLLYKLEDVFDEVEAQLD